MSASRSVRRPAPSGDAATRRTIRFPAWLEARLVRDAQRWERSVPQQVLAVLRRHDEDQADVVPRLDVEQTLTLVRESVRGISRAEQDRMWGRRRAK